MSAARVVTAFPHHTNGRHPGKEKPGSRCHASSGLRKKHANVRINPPFPE
jgi:hypothetical protein